jgi:predicted anti-sigma-YlaC factor YlaD
MPETRTCSDARQWVSAFRDGDALPDAEARAHIDSCADCTAWERSLAELTRKLVVRAADAPDVTSAAVAAWGSRPVRSPQQIAARVILALAGAVGLVLAGVAMGRAGGPSAAHLSQDLGALQAGLSLGFLLAAWRPERYCRALVPVAAVAGTLTLLSSHGFPAADVADLLVEATHLPVLVGFAGLLLWSDAWRAGNYRQAKTP